MPARRAIPISLLALLVLTLAALAACGGTAVRPASTPPGGAGANGGAPPPGPIAVSLREWAIDLGAPRARAGAITFDARNDGKVPHNLVVVRSDLAPDRLPTASGIVDERRVTFVGRTEELVPGSGARLSVTLAAGKYVLICNVIGHYNSGQFAAFTVE